MQYDKPITWARPRTRAPPPHYRRAQIDPGRRPLTCEKARAPTQGAGSEGAHGRHARPLELFKNAAPTSASNKLAKGA